LSGGGFDRFYFVDFRGLLPGGGAGLGLILRFRRILVEFVDGDDEGVEAAGVAVLKTLEGEEEGFLAEDCVVGKVSIVGVGGVGLGVEVVLDGEGEFAVAVFDPELVVELAEGGIGVLRRDGERALVVEGGEGGVEGMDLRIETMAARILGDALFAGGRAGTGGFAGVGAVGGEAAF